MKTRSLPFSLRLAVLLFAAGFFIRSINVASAAPTPERFLQSGTTKIGKYSICIFPSSSGMVATILNTESGASETYMYTSYSKPWEKLPQQLPQVSF